MKKIKTLSFAFAGALLLLVAGPPRPAFAGTYFDVNRIVNVSTDPTKPSVLISTQGTVPYADVRILCTQFNVAGEYLLVDASSTSFSTSATTGTARIPCLPATVQQLDFWLNDWRSGLYGVVTTTYTIPVNVWRKR